jgi:hypothetical protein
VAILGYLFTFRELLVGIAILLIALGFLSPVLALSYFACRFSLRLGSHSGSPSPPRSLEAETENASLRQRRHHPRAQDV